MSGGDHWGPAVRGVAARIEAELPALIQTAATDQGVVNVEPIRAFKRVRREAEAAFVGAAGTALPLVFILIEGSVERERWITPQVDHVAPLLVRLIYYEANTERVDSLGEVYDEALERCLDAHVVDAATKIWWFEFEDTVIDQHGADVHRRQVDARGMFKVRTNRSEA